MLVVFWNNGQLGNRLFYFSHFVAFATETKSKLLCMFFSRNAKHYADPFEGSSKNLIGYYPKPILHSGTFIYRATDWLLYKLFLISKKYNFNNKIISIYTPTIEGKEDSQSYSVQDFISNPTRKKSLITFYNSYIFWHDNTNLAKYHTQITAYFKPIEPHWSNIKNFSKNIRAEFPDSIIVGVHIRRGDYKDWAGGMWYFEDDAFAQHLRNIENKLNPKKTVFVICSNEDVNFENYQNLELRKSTGHIIEDMYILAECDYIVGPHSTYSMWASFYGQKPLYKMRKDKSDFSLSDFSICNGRFYEPSNN